jgi:hypothetical protein
MPSQITYESPPKQGPHVDKLVMTARQAWQLRLPPTEKGTRTLPPVPDIRCVRGDRFPGPPQAR